MWFEGANEIKGYCIKLSAWGLYVNGVEGLLLTVVLFTCVTFWINFSMPFHILFQKKSLLMKEYVSFISA